MPVKSVNDKFKCNICGNEVIVIKMGGGTLVCCGEEMELVGPKKGGMLMEEGYEIGAEKENKEEDENEEGLEKEDLEEDEGEGEEE